MVGSGLPGMLLLPSWQHDGEVPPGAPIDKGQAFDVGRPSGFTLCAFVRRAPGEPGGGLILQKGEPPNGWAFYAPSAVGAAIAFSSGSREELPTTAAEPAAAPADGEADAGAPAEGEGEAAPEDVAPPRGDLDIGVTRLDDGEWHHVVMTLRSGRLYAYVDGRPDGDLGVEVAAAPKASLMLGAAPEEDGSQSADGLRDVKAFAETLSDEQIADIAAGARRLSQTGLPLPLLPGEVLEFWRLTADVTDPSCDDEGTAKAKSQLERAFALGSDPDRGFQDEVVIDFFFYLLVHCRSICLNAQKSAVVVAIMDQVFSSMHRRSQTSPCIGESYTVTECFQEYKKLITAHSAATPGDYRLCILTPPDVKQISDYVSTAFFQHQILYQSVLVCPQNVVVTYVDACLDRPREPPDIRKAKMAEYKGRAARKDVFNRRGSSKEHFPRRGSKETSRTASKDSLKGREQADESADEAAAQEQQGGDADADIDVDGYIATKAAAAENELQAMINKRDRQLGLGSKSK
eukprot:gnl/TRDRNA2_/TRDRNA2_131458_c0_seq1.p1 gnl/TRDRNA2_/TRDRNA2_131458_c0~~gnl/TRDRNA2_/TRDRNA2_131458_c0_seq1.p1  ORF type:complete len:543 (+),score=121.68 gnl/TRDRNA2_/TRDRNA2_131458_c0_seq1:77-1630(+)